ncbi:hypothetical protein l13_17250 [Neisseria weaveri ATCC 51223]|nr:hypothetical protein l13_17250 [Neisseria weaveri ATCC 51223]
MSISHEGRLKTRSTWPLDLIGNRADYFAADMPGLRLNPAGGQAVSWSICRICYSMR